jgi:ubiquinone biosynthesis monooxygenase Coq7
VIDEHYARQAAALEADGEARAEFKATIEKFRAEEIQHRETAIEHGAEEAPGYRVLSETIKAGCRLAIKLSERF